MSTQFIGQKKAKFRPERSVVDERTELRAQRSEIRSDARFRNVEEMVKKLLNVVEITMEQGLERSKLTGYYSRTKYPETRFFQVTNMLPIFGKTR